jgi:hypothetical protein
MSKDSRGSYSRRGERRMWRTRKLVWRNKEVGWKRREGEGVV